jgi:hypothetical protein
MIDVMSCTVIIVCLLICRCLQVILDCELPSPEEAFKMGIGFGTFMKPVEVRSEEGRETSLNAECEAEGCSLD